MQPLIRNQQQVIPSFQQNDVQQMPFIQTIPQNNPQLQNVQIMQPLIRNQQQIMPSFQQNDIQHMSFII